MKWSARKRRPDADGLARLWAEAGAMAEHINDVHEIAASTSRVVGMLDDESARHHDRLMELTTCNNELVAKVDGFAALIEANNRELRAVRRLLEDLAAADRAGEEWKLGRDPSEDDDR